ncbi:inositol monophosphatase family protein [Streptomyces sp. NPDC001816]|uniref:inositol monophosphatase family protein n=1 Tax=Streptomyces sp. NPDC001816 TaxID=3364612 RepID=UPI0036BA3D56
MPRVPGVRIEGEEYGVHEGTKGAPHWVIDPVDGTTNYAHGIGWCSFSLGLASPQGVPLLACRPIPGGGRSSRRPAAAERT